ncbi:MAG: ring-opening amidohydrolase [Firmicutes bacterium]|nr:ring-opening amidohydrolase [Bacillota bacterium]
MLNAKVFRIEMNSPDDVSGLQALLDNGELQASEILAILGKTEGNGCVNDFTRGFSTMAFRSFLAKHQGISEEEVEEQVAFVMSGGTEGVMTPHATIFAQSEEEGEPGEPGLAIGVAFTRDFLPEEIGTMTMVEEVAQRVKEAMAAAKIENREDVHFVQIKCPLLTSDRINDAKRRGKEVVVTDTYESMGYSRAASALGIGLALGEVSREDLSDAVIAKDWDFYSAVASTSAGVELMNCEIILLGNSAHSSSAYRIGHAVMKDSIDLAAVLASLKDAGLEFQGLPSREQLDRVVNIFAKAEADPTGFVRGRRTTMLTDSDINHTRHARAVVNGVIAGVVGDPMVYVSGGSEHQGPAGGGPIAVIVKK